MAARSSSPTTPSLSRISSSCCTSSSSACRRSLRQGSPSRKVLSQSVVVPTFKDHIHIFQSVSLSQSVEPAMPG